MDGEQGEAPSGSVSEGFAALFDLTGKTLGKYRLVDKLGQGGMAQVYRAYQPGLDRYVALKILHPHLTADAEFAARFEREARAVATLDHPHIVRVYDFDAAEGMAFLVMEYLEGNNLKSRLHDMDCRGERMELAEAARIVAPVAEALDHAHRQGLVHRDIKPSNVLITADGRPVLTDFGIARMVDATTAGESGGTLGTPAYMSPEQGQGAPGDARSDVYSLGIVLYQLCTGRLPFDADTPYAVVLKHISAPLPLPRSIRPDLPEAVERVILKALAKNPDERYQTAGDLGRALQAALDAPPPARHATRPRTRKQSKTAKTAKPDRTVRWAAVAGVLGLAVLALLARPWRWLPTPALPAPTGEPTTVPAVPRNAATLVLQGPDVTADTWLNPDLPDEPWHEADLVHLQGPLTPDRLLFRFQLPELPAGATVVSATLALQVELWGEQSFPGAAVVYRVLAPWEAPTATYNAPWGAPGLVAGWDYDSVPLDLVPVPDQGTLVFDVTQAAAAWHERGEPNYGLVVMMSDDSHNQAHHWVLMSEQAGPADRPALSLSYAITP